MLQCLSPVPRAFLHSMLDISNSLVEVDETFTEDGVNHLIIENFTRSWENTHFLKTSHQLCHPPTCTDGPVPSRNVDFGPFSCAGSYQSE